MTAFFEATVGINEWQHEAGDRNGNGALAGTVGRDEKEVDNVGPWQPAVKAMVDMQHLSDGWDGFDAKAPAHKVLESAIGLAHLWCDNGVSPPDRVVPALDGCVMFEWQFPDGTYADVEIDRPFHAEAMVIEPGRPRKQWTLPTE